jgi:hypothetical protein
LTYQKTTYASEDQDATKETPMEKNRLRCSQKLASTSQGKNLSKCSEIFMVKIKRHKIGSN